MFVLCVSRRREIKAFNIKLDTSLALTPSLIGIRIRAFTSTLSDWMLDNWLQQIVQHDWTFKRMNFEARLILCEWQIFCWMGNETMRFKFIAIYPTLQVIAMRKSQRWISIRIQLALFAWICNFHLHHSISRKNCGKIPMKQFKLKWI